MPSDVAFYKIYIVDSMNCTIRKVKSNGIITTIAGNGYPRFSGVVTLQNIFITFDRMQKDHSELCWFFDIHI